MSKAELTQEKESWLSQITGESEAERYLNALIKVVYWATEARQININNELQSVFDLIQYYKASALLNAFQEGKESAL